MSKSLIGKVNMAALLAKARAEKAPLGDKPSDVDAQPEKIGHVLLV